MWKVVTSGKGMFMIFAFGDFSVSVETLNIRVISTEEIFMERSE